MSINSVSISGNLTRDCELRTTQNGTKILTFTVAVNDRKRDQNGEWVDVPNYIGCCIFGNRAEFVSRFISKGSKVSCHGKLRWTQWQEKQTQKNRSKIEVIVDEIEFMSRKDNPQSQSNGSYGQQPNNYTNNQQYSPQNGSQGFSGGYQQQDVYDSDIPW